MGKVKTNGANLVPAEKNNNEEQHEIDSESEMITDSESEEDSSSMELSETSGDEDVIVSNLFVIIIYIDII